MKNLKISELLNSNLRLSIIEIRGAMYPKIKTSTNEIKVFQKVDTILVNKLLAAIVSPSSRAFQREINIKLKEYESFEII